MYMQDKKNTFTFKNAEKHNKCAKCEGICYRKLENQEIRNVTFLFFFSITLKSTQFPYVYN